MKKCYIKMFLKTGDLKRISGALGFKDPSNVSKVLNNKAASKNITRLLEYQAYQNATADPDLLKAWNALEKIEGEQS